MQSTGKNDRNRLAKLLLFCAVALAFNLIGARLAAALKLPIYLDNVGTLLSAALGGYVPGVVVGYLTNLLNGIGDGITPYYGMITVMIAVCATCFYRKGWFRNAPKAALSVLVFALLGGGVGSVLTWFLYGMGFGTGISAPLAHRIYSGGLRNVFLAQLSADMLIDLLDKAVVVAIALLLMRVIPSRFTRLDFGLWQQKPMSRAERYAMSRGTVRKRSLRFKVTLLISAAMLIVALVTTGISFTLYHRANVSSQAEMAMGIANVAASAMNPDHVAEYMEQGDSSEEYRQVELTLKHLRDSAEEVSFVYVYRIMEDGCHVVFDPDAPGTPGADPGSVVEFESAFLPYVPALVEGKSIKPIISNDEFGWLLTVYQPVFGSDNRCVCHVGVDISMRRLMVDEYSFLAKVVSLFLGFFVLILAVTLWMADYAIILPINAIAKGANGFAFNSEASREQSLERLKSLDVRTGDEIENLYHAFSKTSEETVQYIADVQKKNETIARMQDSLITVLADMVESRDKYTGDHVRKTAAYAAIIMDQLRKEGIYADVLTDEYVSDVMHAAPLHDVGKIEVSDTILNKPGRLTDEEFHRMQQHTVVGKDILCRAVGAVSEAGYLTEAQNLANYHHERWDGKGYPTGLKGEDIPLSARIMAVADVFDALVSKRSYKDGFPIEKALDIIREGVGSHFDPNVANAFLHAEDEVRRVAAMHAQMDQASDNADGGEQGI